MIQSHKIRWVFACTLVFSTCHRDPPFDAAHYRLDDLTLDTTRVPRRRFVLKDSNGVALIQNGLDGLVAPNSPQVERVYRVGVVTGTPEYEVWAVDGLVVDDNSNRFVSSAKSGWVRVYDKDGRHIREFGGRGNGPGDFLSVSALFLAGDTLVLVDRELRRTTLFARDGSVLRTWSNHRPDGFQYTPVGATQTTWIVHVQAPPPRGFREVQALGRTFLQPQYEEPKRFAARSLHEDHDSLFRFRPDSQRLGEFLYEVRRHPRYKTHSLEQGAAPAFAGQPSFAFDRRGYFYVTRPTTYRIDVYDDSGKHLRGISKDYLARPITEEIVSKLRLRLRQHLDTILPSERRGLIRKRIKSVGAIAEIPLPPLFAPLGSVRVSPEGYIWVNRRDAYPPDEYWIRRFDYVADTEGHFAPLPASWDVFAPDGAFLAQVRFPAGFQLMAISGSDAHGVEKDALGVEYIATYHVRGLTDEFSRN